MQERRAVLRTFGNCPDRQQRSFLRIAWDETCPTTSEKSPFIARSTKFRPDAAPLTATWLEATPTWLEAAWLEAAPRAAVPWLEAALLEAAWLEACNGREAEALAGGAARAALRGGSEVEPTINEFK